MANTGWAGNLRPPNFFGSLVWLPICVPQRLYSAEAIRKEVRSYMKHRTVHLLRLVSLLVVADANHVVAQSHAPVSRGDAVSKSSRALPKSCLVQEHPSEQISVLLETIRDHPTAGAYNTIGALYAQNSRVACAISAFEAALRLDGKNWQSHYNLGLALLTKGDRARAAAEFQAAIRQKPDSVASHFALGTLLQEERKLYGAIAEFQAVLQIDHNFAPACLSLGALYTQQGKDSEAADLFRQAIQSDPKYIQAYVNLGLTMARHGEFAEAEKQFRSAIQ